jgi:hypothetical protein
MKVWTMLICLVITSPALAQNVTCTADVPTDTCKTVSALFSRQIKSQIVIADPASFRREQESLNKRYETSILLGDLRNPVIPNRYTDDILLVRDDKPCPTRVVISTDAFRPFRIKEGAKGEQAVEYMEGFDLFRVNPLAIYVDGFVEGCTWGILTYLGDEVNKPGKRK